MGRHSARPAEAGAQPQESAPGRLEVRALNQMALHTCLLQWVRILSSLSMAVPQK